MSIGVQSFPELYTTLMGWDLYDKMWSLLTQTGLAYLPFIGMIMRNVAQSYVSHHDTGKTALHNMEINLVTTLLIILFAVSPCIPLSAHTVSYSPSCGSDQSKTYYPGNTGTTYDNAFSIPSDSITVPLWWFSVMSVSEGITNAANTMLGCTPNLRKMVTEVDMAQISDPQIKQELLDFESMCYMPARTQFNQDKQANNTNHLDIIDNDINKYGVEDTEWLGSHSFGDVYYKNLNASKPVPGFPYDATEDINADVNQANPPAYGTPSCSEWWSDDQYGLKNRIYQVLPKSFSDEFGDYLNDANTRDDVIKKVITNANGYNNANATIADQGYSHLVSAVGIWFQQLEEYPKLYAASQAAPIIQALLLLMIYVFLPFALLFSSYRSSSVITGAMMVFSVIFWGFIWHLVSWTDNALMQALYSNWFERQGAGATLADMIIASLIIFSPIFWFVFMGAMGVAVGDIVSSFSMGMNKIGNDAASAGLAKAKATAAAVGKAAMM